MANVINSLKLGDCTYVFTNPYATCDTPAAGIAKAATITPGSNFSLETGARVVVKFTYANTAATPTLNINSTGAKHIYLGSDYILNNYYWTAGSVKEFVYDGTGWQMMETSAKFAGGYTTGGAANSAIKLASARTIDGVSFNGEAAISHYGSCSTAAGTAEKAVSCTGFSLVAGARITVKFTVTNTAANPTLNVNSTGAKAIYYRGSAISAGYLAANRTYEFVYNGTQYELVGDIDTDTNTNTSHSHNAGVGLVGSGSASTSGGTYTYKAKLKDETKNANDSLARPSANANRLYPVEVDKSGYLAVTVPWSDTDTTTTTGATDTSSKIFLVGATSQSLAPTTYSHDTAYVGTDGCLYSNSKKVATLGDTNEFTGTNTFQGSTTFLTASAGINDPKTHVAADGVRCATASGPSTHYMYGKIINGTKTLTLPSNKDGTIALTSDIPSIGTFDDSIDIWDTTYSGDKYVSIEAAGSGSICVHNDDEGTLLTLNLPAINDGTYTIATTNEVNNILTGSNTYTGYNYFDNTLTCRSGVVATNGTNLTDNAGLKYNCITRYIGNTAYTLTIPNKTGTIALTSDIPSTNSFVTIANEQTITGKKIFNGGVQFGANTVFNNNGIQIPAANAFKVMGMYDISFPSKSGTIALTSDIPSGHVYLHKVSFDIVAGDTKGYFTTINNDNTALSSLSAASLEALLGKCFPAAVSGETYQGGAVSVLINVNRSFVVVEGVVLDSAGQSPKRLFKNVNISDLSDTVTQII